MSSGWAKGTLAQLASYHNGRAFKPSDWTERGLPIVRIAQISNPEAVPNYYGGHDVDDKHLIGNGDILFSWSATLAVVKWNNGPAILNQHIFKVVENEGVYRDFLRYLLQHSLPALAERSHGSTMKHIRKGVLREYAVSVPPLPEQRKIAAILSSVDDAIEKTQSIIDQMRVVKRGLLQGLLTRGLPGRHTRFKQTEIGEIPEDWEVVELASVATIERGRFNHRPRNDPRFYGGSYPFIQTGDVAASDGEITTYNQTLNEKGLTVSKLFPAGTIIVTIAANIGSTGITTFDVAFPDSLIGIQAGPRVDTRFLELILRTRKRDLNRFAPESAQKNINLETLKPLKVPLPGMAEQRRIAKLLWSIIHCGKSAQLHRDGITRLKSGLMPVLLTGELRVTPDAEGA